MGSKTIFKNIDIYTKQTLKKDKYINRDHTCPLEFCYIIFFL